MAASHISFGTTQAYYAIPGDTTLQDPAAFSPGLRFYYPCDAITFTMSYDKMYYTKKDDKGKYYRIFVSDHIVDRKGKGSWSRSEEPLALAQEIIHYSSCPRMIVMMIFDPTWRERQKFDLFLTRRMATAGQLRKSWAVLSIKRMNFNLPRYSTWHKRHPAGGFTSQI